MSAALLLDTDVFSFISKVDTRGDVCTPVAGNMRSRAGS